MQSNTAATKAYSLGRLERAGFNLEKLTAEDLPEVQKRLGWAESTYRTALAYLKKSNEANKLAEGFNDYIPTEREKRIVKTQFGAFGFVLVWAGCRFSEMWRMKLDLPNNRVTVYPRKKNNKPYHIGLEELSPERLKQVKQWINIESQEVTPVAMRKRWQRQLNYSGKVSKECQPHAFRHLLISQHLEEGVSVAETASNFGHKDVRTTLRYNNSCPKKAGALRSRFAGN